MSTNKKLFLEQKVYIMNTGLISEPFRIQRGMQHGDPLSLLLYILAFEFFLRSASQKLQGIQRSIAELIQNYELASNARVNKILKNDETIKILGYKLDHNGDLNKEVWPNLVKKIKNM
ncbi:9619_t:CDS:2, partial [Gigaspora rosea]